VLLLPKRMTGLIGPILGAESFLNLPNSIYGIIYYTTMIIAGTCAKCFRSICLFVCLSLSPCVYVSLYFQVMVSLIARFLFGVACLLKTSLARLLTFLVHRHLIK
jgi:hypothetical protein